MDSVQGVFRTMQRFCALRATVANLTAAGVCSLRTVATGFMRPGRF